MSFRVDLWNGLDIIKNQFFLTFNKASNLCSILLSYAGCQKAYYKSLESLYKDNKDKEIFKTDYSLDKNILELVNKFKSESNYFKEHYKYIKHCLIEPLKELIDKGKLSFNNIYNEGLQIQENFIKNKNELIIKQNNFNNSVKDFYSFISNLDENEIKDILENDNNIIDNKEANPMPRSGTIRPEMRGNLLLNDESQNKINQALLSKKGKLIEKIIENQNEYCSSLEEANEYLISYRNKNENILQSLEDLYKNLINNIRLTLFSTIENRLYQLKNLDLLYNNFLNNNINAINIKNEILEFIIRNATKEFPINKFEFFLNKFDNNKSLMNIDKYLKENFSNSKEPKRGKSRKKTEIRNFRRRSVVKKNTGDKNDNRIILENTPISNDIKKYKINSNISLIDDFIEELITNKDDMEINDLDNIYYHDSSSKMIDISHIKILVDKQTNERLLYLDNIIKFLNVRRAKGNFIISEKSYDIFIEFFKFILDNYSTFDSVLKNIIILCQTFYKIEIGTAEKNELDNQNKKKKIFITNGLRNLPIFNNPETWHRVINFNLATNIMPKDISQPIDNDVYKKLNILVNNILIAYLCDIKYFSDDINVFNEIKDYYVRVYQLDGLAIFKEVSGIVNYEPIKQRKKEVFFSIKKTTTDK